MRSVFIEHLCRAASADDRIHLLTGDLGFSVLEPFATQFPDRFINVGVAEQNMIGIAAGLAAAGKIPAVYSIANFITLRCLEQIRNDVCYHGFKVIIVSVGGGYAYGTQGYTHHAVEDMACLRSLPNLSIYAPFDREETSWAFNQSVDSEGPSYIRLGKTGEKSIQRPNSFSASEAGTYEVQKGSEITLVSTGSLLGNVLATAEKLAQRNLSCRVLSVPRLSPFDGELIAKAALETDAVFTFENHSATGGLGSAVAEVMASLPGKRGVLYRYGANDSALTTIGCEEYLQGSVEDMTDFVETRREPLRQGGNNVG